MVTAALRKWYNPIWAVMDEPTFWVGRWLRQGGGLGGDVNILPYLRLNTIFFSHSYSPWSRERGEGEGESRSPKFICSYRHTLLGFHFHSSYRTVIYLAISRSYTRAEEDSRFVLCPWLDSAWSCTHAGGEVAVGADRCSEMEGVGPPPRCHYRITRYYWLWLQKVMGCNRTPQG